MSIQHLLNVDDSYADLFNIGCNSLASNTNIIINNDSSSNNLYASGSAVSSVGFGTVQPGQYKIIAANVGPTGITVQSGGIANVIHTNGSGVYTVTYSGISVAPFVQCTCSTSLRLVALITSVSNIATQISIFDPVTGVATDSGFYISIMGLAS